MGAKAKAMRRRVERPRVPGAPYSIDQAAGVLGIAPRTVRDRIAAGLLRAFKDGRRVLIAEEELARYRAERRGDSAAGAVTTGTGLVIPNLLRSRRGARTPD